MHGLNAVRRAERVRFPRHFNPADPGFDHGGVGVGTGQVGIAHSLGLLELGTHCIGHFHVFVLVRDDLPVPLGLGLNAEHQIDRRANQVPRQRRQATLAHLTQHLSSELVTVVVGGSPSCLGAPLAFPLHILQQVFQLVLR